MSSRPVRVVHQFGAKAGARPLSPSPRSNDSPNLLAVGTDREERPNQEIHADGRIGRFHFGNTRLAGTHTFCQVRLRPLPLLSQFPKASCESELDFYKLRFVIAQAKEIPCVADSPTRGSRCFRFSSFTLLSLRQSPVLA